MQSAPDHAAGIRAGRQLQIRRRVRRTHAGAAERSARAGHRALHRRGAYHPRRGGGQPGNNDLANIIKPALARGEIACIAATTDEEYRLYLESDTALERRFQPIRVQELSAAQTLEVLRHLRETLAQLRGVDVPADQLAWIVDFAGQYLHNRHFPDKAVDILEQCVAYGLAQGKRALSQQDVEVVARRMAGMPPEVEQRLHALREALIKRSLLPQQTVEALINRLGVTLRGFELRVAAPQCGDLADQ